MFLILIFIVVSCDVLPPPDNGGVEQPMITFMSTATYSCNTGFGLVGESTRTCQANTTWSGEAPTCRQCKPADILSKLYTRRMHLHSYVICLKQLLWVQVYG